MSTPGEGRDRPVMPAAPRPGAASASAGSDPAAPAPTATPGPVAARPAELGGPKGLEPTRYGDWERDGRCVDF